MELEAGPAEEIRPAGARSTIRENKKIRFMAYFLL
jgi:hypothetical protein